MKFSDKICLLKETAEYLRMRLKGDRIGKRISALHNEAWNEVNFDLACFKKIAALESELDGAFPEDDLMRFYFQPMEVYGNSQAAISLGDMLLTLPSDLCDTFTLDHLIEFYETEPQEKILSHFRSTSLSSFFSEDKVYCEGGLSEFITIINSAFVRSDDKWNIIDAATNPCAHLKKLRPLLLAVSEFIEQRMDSFSLLLDQCRSSFSSYDAVSLSKKFQSMNIDIDLSNYNEICIYPSIFLFNGLNLNISSSGDVRIFIGVFVDKIFEIRMQRDMAESYITMLKVLSDGTRLKALHEMCDKYSYGQELAERIGGTRNAMYYHLEKMMSIGLIDCKVTDYRMLYTMNKRSVYDKLTALRDYLLNGWTPDKE